MEEKPIDLKKIAKIDMSYDLNLFIFIFFQISNKNLIKHIINTPFPYAYI
jgi:hypothetical protein